MQFSRYNRDPLDGQIVAHLKVETARKFCLSAGRILLSIQVTIISGTLLCV